MSFHPKIRELNALSFYLVFSNFEKTIGLEKRFGPMTSIGIDAVVVLVSRFFFNGMVQCIGYFWR